MPEKGRQMFIDSNGVVSEYCHQRISQNIEQESKNRMSIDNILSACKCWKEQGQLRGGDEYVNMATRHDRR